MTDAEFKDIVQLDIKLPMTVAAAVGSKADRLDEAANALMSDQQNLFFAKGGAALNAMDLPVAERDCDDLH